MKQLTGLDASFLNMESRTTTGHVAGLAIYQRPDPSFDPYAAVYERVGAMVGRLEPLRRRVVTVPLQLDHPYWIEDPDFDLDYHVRHLGLAPPGAADQLSEQVARIVARRLDRDRPLWELYVIEGLADQRWALLWKTHHATIDGAAGVILLNMLTDTTPDPETKLEPVEWTPEPIPSDAEMLRLTLRSLVENPIKNLRLQLKVARNLADGVGAASVSATLAQVQDRVRAAVGAPTTKSNEDRVTFPITPAPSTPWNRQITSARRFAMRSTSMNNIRRLKDASGGTVNDIVMAVCTGALRQYLIDHDALPDRPLRAMVPVSIRTGDEEDPWTNRVSGIIADLPTNLDDPVERVRACHDAMEVAKRQFELVPAESLIDITQTASPVVATAATRLASRLANRVNMPANVVISNVPGPRVPLYFAGARLDHYIPVSIVTDGMGLNITVHSYLDKLDFGLIADRELVPDLWHLVDLHVAEVGVLFDALGAEWAEPQVPAAMRAGRPGATGTGRATTPRAKPTAKKTTKKTAKRAPKQAAAKATSGGSRAKASKRSVSPG